MDNVIIMTEVHAYPDGGYEEQSKVQAVLNSMWVDIQEEKKNGRYHAGEIISHSICTNQDMMILSVMVKVPVPA
ncbi:hypothetical protein ACFLU3_00965 [Chloroflexota bacterium]